MPSTKTTSSCLFCPGGRVGPPGLVPVVPAREFLCLPCAAGKYRGQTDRVDVCIDCPVGLAAPADAAECTQCEAGRVTNSNGDKERHCLP